MKSSRIVGILHYTPLHLPLSFSLCSSFWLVYATPAFVHFCKKSRIRTVYMLLRRYRRYFPSLTLLKVSKILPGNLACTLMNINLKFRAWKRKPRVQRRYPIGDIEPRAAFSASKKRGLSKMDNWNDSIGLERILINCILLCQIFDKWGEVD